MPIAETHRKKGEEDTLTGAALGILTFIPSHLALLLAAAACGEGRDAAPAPSEPTGIGTYSTHRPASSAPTTATPLIIVELSKLGRADMLSPAMDIPCSPPFVHGFKCVRGDETFYKAMSWNGSTDAKDALEEGSLCYAAGPHKAFNPTNWCCK